MDIWKTIASAACACVVCMVSFWLIESRNYVTLAETRHVVKTEAPYNEDRKVITLQIERLINAIEELKAEVARLRK